MGEIFIKRLANYQAIIYMRGKKQKSCSFFSKRNPRSVARLVGDTIYIKDTDKKEKVRIVFQKLLNEHDNSCLECWTHLETPEQVAQEMMLCVRNDAQSLDVKETRFTIIIRNEISSESDTKNISFNDRKSFEDVFSLVKFVAQQIEQQTKNSMLYISDTPMKSSHTIILMRSGRSDRIKQSSKSFSINIPYFSSEEIAEMFQGRQQQ